MIELRVLTSDDWAIWRELRLAALADAPSAFGSRLADWQGDGDREERWRARLEIPGSYHLVAVLDGQSVGMVSGVPGPHDGIVEIISMWVGAAARGHGVAERLVGAVEEWALGVRAEVLRLDVAPGNERAIAFYRRIGLADTGEEGDVLPGGERRIVMEKALKAAH
ncbi:GNAT family N-acetyltransferase [Streptomyces sp. NBS 14/10]|uniref:GNAT family N-acetyltransferase n=1 Tax=Streptomyces sp. NBS 14/10 TaxID=1945643 RepID=UPI000B80127E|nr:GNAT family N-acetyltransferase [Streptomyces sp. NBS 14/10]KAK1181774.1 GNAT family N-acetyltransferase [Streptomyces sp. NBS 14/10]